MEVTLESDKTANNTASFNQDDVVEKYLNLKSQYASIAKQYDAAQQELHDLKRSNQFSAELKDHLTLEIEALQKNEVKIKAECAHKCALIQEDIERLKDEKWKETEQMTATIESLEKQVSVLKQNHVPISVEKPSSALDNTKLFEDVRQLEDEVTALKEANANLKQQLAESLTMNEIYKEKSYSLNERVECLQSNLDSKKEELASITDMLHSAQGDLCSANVELQQFKSSASSFAPKGNSLFAEVDDKRQEMLKSLSQMKDKVYQLNRELVSKQAEIDSLLCEKKALWEEYSGQSNHCDAVLSRAYERRITDLEKQNYQLHRDVARWFERNMDPSSSEAAQWINGVLEHYKMENGRLSSELTAASVNNLSAEQKIRESQRQIVTWRTKAMEARAAISELQTKLQLAEKNIQLANSTTLEGIEVEAVPIKTPSPSSNSVRVKDEINTTLKEGFREINMSNIQKSDETHNESVKIKKSSPALPSILAGAGAENKVPKKTTFK